ncbi:MAG: metallophosphoesterase [Clostridiales bacterium]|nr:metallophosphoesterase [Clostridiales bacterium]
MPKNKLRPIFLSILLIILTISICSTRLKIQHYTVVSAKIDSRVRIALISDLHSSKYGDKESLLIQAIDSQNPDLICLVGDICDDKIPHDNSEALLKGIADRYPCFYVTGNHEYWGHDIDTILRLFEKYQVEILSGDHQTVTVNGNTVNLCGITDPDAARYTDSPDIITQLNGLKDVSQNGSFTLLLAHRPEYIETYDQYSFDLVLSGHAHGGQWRIPGILNGFYAPNQGLFPKYAGGSYTVGSTQMIVSRGLALESTKLPRIFNRPELVIIDLE